MGTYLFGLYSCLFSFIFLSNEAKQPKIMGTDRWRGVHKTRFPPAYLIKTTLDYLFQILNIRLRNKIFVDAPTDGYPICKGVYNFKGLVPIGTSVYTRLYIYRIQLANHLNLTAWERLTKALLSCPLWLPPWALHPLCTTQCPLVKGYGIGFLHWYWFLACEDVLWIDKCFLLRVA